MDAQPRRDRPVPPSLLGKASAGALVLGALACSQLPRLPAPSAA